MHAGMRPKFACFILLFSCVNCSQQKQTDKDLADQIMPESHKVTALRLILDDVRNGLGKDVILETFKLRGVPPNIVLEKPPYEALGIPNPLIWPEPVHKPFKLFGSLEAVVRERRAFNGAILVVRLDKLGLERTEASGGNCRVVVTVVDSDSVPTNAVGLNYLAYEKNGAWNVELVLID